VAAGTRGGGQLQQYQQFHTVIHAGFGKGKIKKDSRKGVFFVGKEICYARGYFLVLIYWMLFLTATNLFTA
jgi:hypothetical protein